MTNRTFYLHTKDVLGPSNNQLRGVSEILGRNGYPTRIAGDGEDWMYRWPAVDEKTAGELKTIGVELKP